MAPLIRPARPEDAARLTEIAWAAKKSWGYSEAFMAACRAELAVTPDWIAVRRVWVAEVGSEIGGMIALDLRAGDKAAELESFFVDPPFQQQGLGRALLEILLQTCRSHGVATIGLDADPFAEPVYHRLGFHRVGRTASKSIPGRLLPRMERSLSML